MKPEISDLQTYPFQKLAQLKANSIPPKTLSAISLSIGEPQHPSPEFVLKILRDNESRYGNYPATRGLQELREACARWLQQRFSLHTVNPDTQVLPLAGTREGLFSIAQCLIDSAADSLVMMPNPFYQIYEGAALLAGAQPFFMNANAENGYFADLNDISPAEWERCALLYICSPGNPTGAVCSMEYYTRLIELAERHNFVIVSDECYSEIYFDEAPVGLLQACELLGNTEYSRCLVMNSLSKRSNLAGLRSGFVAGDAKLLEKYLLYRTYHGSTLPVPVQLASAAAWSDELHVRENRVSYSRKFELAQSMLTPHWSIPMPDAAFFLWAPTPIDDQEFARRLFEASNVTVLPGSYLSRDTEQGNPGANHVRMALVADEEQCAEALRRLAGFMRTL
ncbi:MAG: succinyldiaminopimelate transaminase [Pseudomonadales bacterium]